MSIVGFNFEKINVERKNPIKGPIKVNSDVNIKEVKKEKFTIGNSEELLRFDFEFKLTYEKIGNVEFKGHILYLEESKKMQEILKEWKENNKIKPEIIQPLINTILTKCNIAALTFEQQVNLPPHLKLPRVTPVKDPKQYIG